MCWEHKTRFLKQLAILPLLMALSACSPQKPAPPAAIPGDEADTTTADPAVLSGASALNEARKFVDLGPKEPGTPSAVQAAQYIVSRLRQFQVEAEIQAFRDTTPHGDMTFRNVLGRIPGDTPWIIMLGAHYDTKTGIPDFVGANDSGSGVGLLLTLARVLQRNAPHPFEIRFAFFDGEECMVNYTETDGFHGSRHLSGQMLKDGSLRRIAAFILLDMVGDKNLSITIPRNSDRHLVSLAFDAARQEGVRHQFTLFPYAIGDDHDAFLSKGVPAIDLIDFQYGSAPGRNDYWHTPEDTIDKLSAESLETVGRVALHMIDTLMKNPPVPAAAP